MTKRNEPSRAASAPRLMLGTAGHIDHGKSSLIQALTGTDPDRLAEEKKRGITIQLGFARLELPDGRSMGVVDVPGHERFVRQMIAGATGIDVALLCIAADDGVMPQTVEHLAVLELLGVPSCVVALTKIDLVDDEWVEFMKDEVARALEATPYGGAPIVSVSSRDGRGLPELLDAVAAVAKRPVRSRETDAARMPIDRVFTVKGSGTVVTGTLWSGAVRVDDELEIMPHNTKARVRSVQMHGESVDEAGAGNRVAINLNAVKASELHAGDFLASPGAATLTDRFDARFSYMGTQSGADKPFPTGTRVHIAHGTREVTGRVLLMDGRSDLNAGESCYAQIRLDAPLPVANGDRFVARSYSPVHVIGGGSVLAGRPRRRTTLSQDETALLDALRSEDVQGACETALAMQRHPASIERIAADAGIEASLVREGLEEMARTGKALSLGGTPGACLATRAVLARDLSAIENELLRFHAENPLQTGMPKAMLSSRRFPRVEPDCFDALLKEAARTGRVVLSDGAVSHPSAAGGAKAAQEQAERAVLAALEKAGRTPPPVDDLIAGLDENPSLCKKALGALERSGDAVRIDASLCFARSAYDELEAAVRTLLESTSCASASELKDAMGLTRKYAMPLLEFMDDRGVTVREGDARRLR